MKEKGFSLISLTIIILTGVFVSMVITNSLPKITPNKPNVENIKLSQGLVDAHNIFGMNALKLLIKEDSEKNVFISPTSIELALSMVLNGADSKTLDQMMETLQVQNFELAEINQRSSDLITKLTNIDKDITLHIANSIWANQGYEFKENFIATNEKFYNAETTTLNFSSPTAAPTINKWVGDNTNGKIKKIVDDPIAGDVIMYLINAIYFKGTWTLEFDKKDTYETPFDTLSGEQNVEMMVQKDDFMYYEDENLQAIQLPYGENEAMYMEVLLPKQKIPVGVFLDQYTTETLADILTQMTKKEGTIELPKFTTEYEKTLNEILITLGMEDAFDPDKANLTKLIASEEGRAFISKVKHKTFLEVNEEGTEAAAVTSVEIGFTAIAPSEEEPFHMKVDHPFLLMIKEKETGLVLFIGQINNPAL